MHDPVPIADSPVPHYGPPIGQVYSLYARFWPLAAGALVCMLTLWLIGLWVARPASQPKLPRRWTPACPPGSEPWWEVDTLQHSAISAVLREWVVTDHSVGLLDKRDRIHGAPAASWPLGQGYRTFITMHGDQGSTETSLTDIPSFSGVAETGDWCWFLSDTLSTGAQLEIVERTTIDPKHRQLFSLPKSVQHAETTQIIARWVPRRSGGNRLLLCGLIRSQGHYRADAAALWDVDLTTGTTVSEVVIEHPALQLYGAVDVERGSIKMLSDSEPGVCWEVFLADGAIQRQFEMPTQITQMRPMNPTRLGFTPRYLPSGRSQAGANAGAIWRNEELVSDWQMPPLQLRLETRARGGTLPLLPHGGHHPTLGFLQDDYGYPTELEQALRCGSMSNLRDRELQDAWLQASAGTQPAANLLDANALAALAATLSPRNDEPMQLYPISGVRAVVTQLVIPAPRAYGGQDGLIRLGVIDAPFTDIRWVAWWPLPTATRSSQTHLSGRFELSGTTGWLLFAAETLHSDYRTLKDAHYAAIELPDFETWLAAHP